MPIYKPAMACFLEAPVLSPTLAEAVNARDDVVTLPIRCRRASLEYNDHNHADMLVVSAEWRDAGVDPRLLKNAVVHFHMGNSDERGVFVPSNDNLRFVGVMNQARRRAKDDGGFEVELDFRDFTAFFLDQKPFPTSGVPDYTQTLREAWRRICDHTGPLDATKKVVSSVEVLRDRLVGLGGVSVDTPLGKAVAERFRRLAKVPVRPKSDSWSVWQQCVGMLGLISYIDRDRCIVTTTTEHFSSDRAPRMVWGKNVLSLEESSQAAFVDKGVAITSFDPLTGTTLEGFYPPPNDDRIHRKRVSASRRRAKPPAFESERYDFFEYNGVTDPDVLVEIAKRAYEERSRQELQGQLMTSELFAADGSHTPFDLLELRAGDPIRVEVDPYDKETLKSLGSDTRRVDYLLARGYSPDVAEFIVRNMSSMLSLEPTFHAARVRTELEADGDGGKFEVGITFHNLIRVAQ